MLVKNDMDERCQKLFYEQKPSEKEYIAMVDGEFPEFPKQIWMDEPMTTNFMTNKTLKQRKPVEALTIFERLSYDPETNTSMVKCQPKTGRTHQIRRHLKMLGHCIVNDVDYNDKDVIDYEQLIESALKTKQKSKVSSDSNDSK